MNKAKTRFCAAMAAVLAGVGAGLASEFVLIEQQSGRAYGPYAYSAETPVLDGRFVLLTQSAGDVSFRPANGAETRTLGPYRLTNAASLRLGERDYTARFVDRDLTRGLAAGRQIGVLRAAITNALAMDDPRSGIAALEAARATNTLARNTHEVRAAIARRQADLATEEANLAKGLEKFDGQWYPKAEAARLRLAREEADNLARGMVKDEGQWVSADVAAERQRVRAEEQRKAALAKKREYDAKRCKRCVGTGWIHYEIRPSAPGLGGKPPPPLRIERAGPPGESDYRSQRERCPDCGGKGVRD